MSVNAETYEVPTLALLSALVAVFATLCIQGRRYSSRAAPVASAPTLEVRHFLWLTGWILLAIQLAIGISFPRPGGIAPAFSRACMDMAALMFLGSLAPQYIREKPRIPYVVALGAPLVAFSTLISFRPQPNVLLHGALVACALAAIYVAARWSLVRHLLPEWFSLLFVAMAGIGCIWLTLHREYLLVVVVVHSGILLVTAVLFTLEFRRLTAGVLLTAGGLLLWALPPLVQATLSADPLPTGWLRTLNLLRVLTAIGMIVLVLEDEIAANLAAQERDRRARHELEKYTSIYLGNIQEKEEYRRICLAITDASRFRQAAIFLQEPEHNYRLAAQSGMDGALEEALDALAHRTSEEKTQQIAHGRYFTRHAGSLTLMDLSPLMQPGDELRQLSFRQAYLMGLRSRDGRLLGTLMLAGVRNPDDPLQTEDVLPLELLAARLGAACEQQILVRRLMQSEKLAGLGQLAGGVAHELNNPLTSVSGFAELLADSEDPITRDQARVIMNEARRMKQIVESLLRFRKATPGERTPVSISLLLADIEKLSRRELDAKRIQLLLRIPEDLPRVRVDGDQIRQVFLQLTRNAITSLEALSGESERRLSIEAIRLHQTVQITFRDTGPGFADPSRAFDPYFSTRHPGEGAGLGLSICYSIVREHGGELTAVNLHPHGAAVVIELPIADGDRESAGTGEPAGDASAASPWTDVQGDHLKGTQ